MSRNPFLRYVLSPLAILTTILIVEWTSHLYGYTATTALPITILTLCLFWSGLKANILSAFFITFYAFHLFYLGDSARFVQIMLTVWPIAIFGGLLKRWLIETVQEGERHRIRAEGNQAKADFVDGLNGNIEYLREINQDLIRLSLATELLSKTDIVESINLIQDKTANLAQRAIGWQQLAEARKIVKSDDHSVESDQ